MTKSDIDAVRRALESFQAVANDPSSAEFWERHRDFHWALLAPAANATVNVFLTIFGKAPSVMCVCSCRPSRPWTQSWAFTSSFTRPVQGVT